MGGSFSVLEVSASPKEPLLLHGRAQEGDGSCQHLPAVLLYPGEKSIRDSRLSWDILLTPPRGFRWISRPLPTQNI